MNFGGSVRTGGPATQGDWGREKRLCPRPVRVRCRCSQRARAGRGHMIESPGMDAGLGWGHFSASRRDIWAALVNVGVAVVAFAIRTFQKRTRGTLFSHIAIEFDLLRQAVRKSVRSPSYSSL
eukprot:gene20630-biopygen20617